MDLTDVERKDIQYLWHKVTIHTIEHEFLDRLLIVYHWNQNSPSTISEMGSQDTTAQSPEVATQVTQMLTHIGEVVKNLGDVKGYYGKFSKSQWEKLYVDPVNFKRFSRVLSTIMAIHNGEEYTPEVQAAFEKFHSGVGDDLLEYYY